MCYTFFLSLSSGSKSPWPCTTAFSQSRLLWNSPLLKCVTYTLYFPNPNPLSHLRTGELIIKDGECSKWLSWVPVLPDSLLEFSVFFHWFKPWWTIYCLRMPGLHRKCVNHRPWLEFFFTLTVIIEFNSWGKNNLSVNCHVIVCLNSA